MNYIRHLTAFYNHVKKDDCLTSSHISLYMALFQYWNFNRFQNPFPVYRDNMMKLSKIGSKNTYHKCIRELHELKYIYYHPSPSKFLPVKVSIGRLDIEEDPVSRYKQLGLFGEESPDSACPKIDTDSVPNLTATCTDFDTVPVPKMGHNIKHKHFIKESKPPAQKIFDKNVVHPDSFGENLREAVNNLGGVPNSVHGCHPERSEGPPQISEVEEFFKSNNYPDVEAKKFFNHYKAIGWKIKGITPIEDWQAAAHKWMINAGKFENKKQEQQSAAANDIESLYKRFLAGENIFKLITPNHFEELKLELTNEIMQHAWQTRTNQLNGSNQNSVLKLLQAYQDNKENDPLLIKDSENLINLAKRIAVFKHFQSQNGNPP
jgi:hypothetical protein